MASYDPPVTADAPALPPGRRRGGRRRPRRARWIVLAVLLVVGIWTAIAGYEMVQARRHAQAGLDRLQSAQKQLDPAELIRGKGLGKLRAARRDFAEASDAADSMFVTPFEIVPVVGRQVRSVRALTGGASTVVHVGVRAMEQSTNELNVTAETGPQRIALLSRLGEIGAQAAVSLRNVSAGPTDALIGPLATAHDKFARQLRKARRAMADVRDASNGIGQMASGPSKYLLLAANNSEMRSGSGMLLSAGVLSTQNGNFSLGPMISVTDLELAKGQVPVTGDYAARWGYTDPTVDWRFLAMSPQFDVTGRLAAEMWKAKTGEDVDGVLALDPIALKALVKVSGPVDVQGTHIDANNIVHEILLQQYVDYEKNNPNPVDDRPANDERRERNGDIARAIVDQLDKVGWHISDLVDDLRTAARGRHVMFWSSKPEQQRAWRAAGVSGVLPRDGLLISIDNLSGNKLDQFLPVGADITHHPVPDGSEVTVTIHVTNFAPTGLPHYVEGPYFLSDLVAGEYRGSLAVNIPFDSRDIHLDGVDRIVAAGPDQTTRVVAGNIRLLRGQSGTYTLRFTVPRSEQRLEVVPSARYPAVGYTAGAKKWSDDGPRTVAW
jgi:hypothetical protein